MFSKNSPTAPSNNNDEFIHAMKDDLVKPFASNNGIKEMNKNESTKDIALQKPSQTSEIPSNSSPFLQNTTTQNSFQQDLSPKSSSFQQPLGTPSPEKVQQQPKLTSEPLPKAISDPEKKIATPNKLFMQQKSASDNTLASKIPFESQVLKSHSEKTVSNTSIHEDTPFQTKNAVKFPSEPTLTTPPVSEYTIEGSKQTHNGRKTFTLILSLLIFLIIIIIGTGAFFYWKTMQPTSPETKQDPQPVQEQPSVTITTPAEKYSLDQPNIINFDVENVTSANIKEKLNQIAKEIETLKPEKPVEFILADANSNSIAFQRFATIAGYTLSQKLLSTLEENFSLLLFIDNSHPRYALNIKIKDKALTLTEMLNQESTLIKDINPLFVIDAPGESSRIFSDGNYNGNPVRYLNLNIDQTLSIDYSVLTNNLVIATSKNTFRAVVDKITSNTDSINSSTIPATGTPAEEALPAGQPTDQEILEGDTDGTETNPAQ